MTAENITELRAELVEVKAAISKARRSKAYTTGGHSLTRQELNELRADKQELIRKIDSMERGGIRVRGMKIV